MLSCVTGKNCILMRSTSPTVIFVYAGFKSQSSQTHSGGFKYFESMSQSISLLHTYRWTLFNSLMAFSWDMGNHPTSSCLLTCYKVNVSHRCNHFSGSMQKCLVSAPLTSTAHNAIRGIWIEHLYNYYNHSIALNNKGGFFFRFALLGEPWTYIIRSGPRFTKLS
jgi:hypothetical protein